MRLYREITQNPNGVYVQWLDDNSELLGSPWPSRRWCKTRRTGGCCDFNDDAQVDVVDIQMVATAWGAANPIYDFDGSGTVDVADLTLVAGRWRR